MYQTLQIFSYSHCGAPVASALAHMEGMLSAAAIAARVAQAECLLPLPGERAAESSFTKSVKVEGLVQQVLQ